MQRVKSSAGAPERPVMWTSIDRWLKTAARLDVAKKFPLNEVCMWAAVLRWWSVSRPLISFLVAWRPSTFPELLLLCSFEENLCVDQQTAARTRLCALAIVDGARWRGLVVKGAGYVPERAAKPETRLFWSTRRGTAPSRTRRRKRGLPAARDTCRVLVVMLSVGFEHPGRFRFRPALPGLDRSLPGDQNGCGAKPAYSVESRERQGCSAGTVFLLVGTNVLVHN